MEELPAERPTPPRWGVRTLAFLGLAAACVLTSNVLHAQDNDDYVLLTFAGIVIGFIGASICTVRGLLSLRRPR